MAVLRFDAWGQDLLSLSKIYESRGSRGEVRGSRRERQGSWVRESAVKPWVPVAAARLVVSPLAAICRGVTLTRPFVSEVAEAVEDARTGGIGHGPRVGQGCSSASTVW